MDRSKQHNLPVDEYLYLPFPTEQPDPTVIPRFFVSDYFDLPCCNTKFAHRHDFYEVHWLSSGSATITTDFTQYHVAGGVLVFISPGQIHIWDNMREYHSNLTVLAFDPMLLTLHGGDPAILMDLPYFDPFTVPYVNVPHSQQGLFDRLFNTVRERYQTITAEHAAILSSYVNVILNEANLLYSQEKREQETITRDSLTRSFQAAVNAHFAERKRVQDYASMLNVTANHLVETVRRKTGKTPGQWQQERVLLEARRLLVHTDNTIAEIALDLSFGSASQFGKWFKNMTDMTPGMFRDSHNGFFAE